MIYKLFKKWMLIPEFIRFFLIGGVNTVIGYSIFVIATFLIGKEHYQICVAIQWIISSITSYINQKIFVFGTKGNYLPEYLKCCSTWVLSYFVNAMTMEIFVKYLALNVYISQFISLFIASFVTYVLFKIYAFRVKNN